MVMDDQDYDEIPLALYLTPLASSDDEEVDPKAYLAAIEREEAERLASEEAATHPVDQVVCITEETEQMDVEEDGDDYAVAHGEISNRGSPMEMDAAHELQNTTDSEMASASATLSPSISADDTDTSETQAEADAGSPDGAVDDTDSDGDEGFELLWSGRVPEQWARDVDADEADALLVHACGCEAPRRCRDPRFGALCAPMKRLLRSACWASHNRAWVAGAAAAQVAKLFGYHSIHCDATDDRSACAVPLCAQLALT